MQLYTICTSGTLIQKSLLIPIIANMNGDKHVTTSFLDIAILFASLMRLISFHFSDTTLTVHSSKGLSCFLVLTHSSMLLLVIALISSANKFGSEYSFSASGNVISMYLKELQDLKIPQPSYVTEGGITMFVSDSHK